MLYRGEFADGKYNGSGELTENGRTFSGEFRNGVLQGSGTISQDGVVLFTGNFTDGIPEGAGKENYADGSLQDRKSTRLNSSHIEESRMPSSA